MGFWEALEGQHLIELESGEPLLTGGMALVYVCGALVILGFAMQKFTEPTYRPDELDPTTSIMPRDLALRGQFATMRAFYAASMLAIYLVLSVIMPLLVDKPAMRYNSPVLAALLLTGVVPTLPWLKDVERWLRGRLHALARVPRGAKDTAYDLRSADFVFAAYQGHLSDPVFRNVDPSVMDDAKAKSVSPLQWSWAVGCCVMHRLRCSRGAVSGCLDPMFLTEYRREFISLRREHELLDRRMADMRRGAVSDKDLSLLQEDVEEFMERLFVFLACAVRLRFGNEVGARKALRGMGFRVPERSGWVPVRDTVLMGLGAVFLIVFGMGWLGGWLFAPYVDPPEFIPKGMDKAGFWALLSVFSLAASMLAVLWCRSRRTDKGRWFRDEEETQRSVYSYFVAGVQGCVAGVAVLMALVAVLKGGPGLADRLWMSFWWFPQYVVMSIFIAAALDNREQWRLQWALEGALGCVVIGLAGFATATFWLAMCAGQALPAGLDARYVAYMSVMTALAGLALGAILPSGYRREKRDRSQSSQSRREKEVLAWLPEIFGGSQERARQWLDTRNSAFGNRPPRSMLGSLPGIRRIKEEALKAAA